MTIRQIILEIARGLWYFGAGTRRNPIHLVEETEIMSVHAIHGHDGGECKAIEVANTLISLGKRDGLPVSNMALQKLLYYTYGWSLAYNNERAFNEAIQAWKFGPVVKSVYHASKRYGTEPIPELLSVLDSSYSGEAFGSWKLVTPELPPSDKSLRSFIESIWSAYGKLPPMDLVKMTHVEGGPWHRVWQDCGGDIPLNTSIPDRYIKEYFTSMLKK